MHGNSDSAHGHTRAVVWIDHLTAKVFTMGITGVTSTAVDAQLESLHLHHKVNTVGSGRVSDDPTFFPAINHLLAGCTDALIVGPGTEKTALLHYLNSRRPDMHLKAEAIDHPTDEEIIALGRKYFHISQVRA